MSYLEVRVKDISLSVFRVCCYQQAACLKLQLNLVL